MRLHRNRKRLILKKNVLSLFSGVGGFDLGLEVAGMKTIYQCEWDKHAISILNNHWPHVPKWGDISTLTAQEILRHGQLPDVIAWGSPCQDLSVAGKRAGLSGERSGLFYEGIRIIKELRKETNNEYPRISIWENVAGALSSNGGADFGEVLNEMAEAGAMVIEWAVLDAQHFGVPQRRRRVFVIAIFDPAIANRCPNPLLPVTESLPGDIKKGKQKRKDTTKETTYRSECSDTKSTALNQEKRLITEPFTGTSRAQYGEGVGTVRAKGGDLGGGSETLLVAFSHIQGLDPQPSETAWPTLRSEGGGHAVGIDTTVRRLTPVECERLMGWPDNWTNGQTDTQRYRQCGNGVAAPVATWVGKKIASLL
jgi:DNA (cytosine-5)-methyltransferase 1